MNNTILSLTKQLIRIPSTADNPAALDDILSLALSHLSDWSIERFEHQGVKSALIYKANTRPSQFKVILNGHLDIVPGLKQRYNPTVIGNKLLGVGALDMKASVACLITVFREVVDLVPYPLGLQLVTDEEIGGFHGTKYQIEQGVKADFVIAAEPTNFNIVHQAKGILQMKITAHGKTAHGA